MKRHTMHPLVVAGGLTAAAIAVVVLATGCDLPDKYTEPFQDAPRTGTADTSAAQVITMPDGFSNLATKCVGGMRYTVAYHGDNTYGAISVVADPKCGR